MGIYSNSLEYFSVVFCWNWRWDVRVDVWMDGCVCVDDAWDDDGRCPSVAASASVCRMVWAVRHARSCVGLGLARG
jgi:hypothetical protein